ncbi:MAG: alanine dehydrogenase [Bacillota bacterium]|nr:alanine dehydrogenase [Bacillota bacterium]MDK2926043.1 alanine dehydrogenase [Bacillota bacterium]
MIVGVPKEIKDHEFRVGMTPAGVEAMCRAGHRVVIEKGAGEGSGISDAEYVQAGAEIVPTAEKVYETAEMIVKVKEPLPAEYDLMHEGQIIFAYLHLAPEKELTAALLRKKVVGVAFETVQLANGALPLLSPMSEIAGRMAVQIGAHYLEKQNGGLGVLLSGVPGVPPAKVAIIGGGTVGMNAARQALGMGADVTVVDIKLDRLIYLDNLFQGRVKTLISNSYNIARLVREADLVIGCVLIPGARTPILVTEEMVKSMKPGAVIVDVAIDQGGSVETMDRITSHSNPTFIKYGVVHYSVPNIPGAVARTATFALANATLPYALQLANKGWKKAMQDDPALAKGLNVVDGKVTLKAVADYQGLPYTPVEEVLN